MKKNNFMLQIKLPEELNKEIIKTANMLGISKSALIRIAVIEKINKIQGEK